MNSRNRIVSRAAKERVLTPQALAQSRSQSLAQDAKALADGREAAALQTRTASLDISASQIRKQSRLLADRSNFLMPTGGGFDGRYGMRLHPILGYYKLHNGDDIGGACGQPIWAAHDGEVIKADTGGYHGGSGNNVRLDAGKIGGHKVESAYLHMNSISVKVGQKVHKGELLGTVGNTGSRPPATCTSRSTRTAKRSPPRRTSRSRPSTVSSLGRNSPNGTVKLRSSPSGRA